MPNYLFLDTEWADPLGKELVSLALVSEDGAVRFYAERDPLPMHPTEFVRHTVYPLLERGEKALPDIEFTRQLRAFLLTIAEPCVLADFPNDLVLLQYALAGFDLSASEAADCGVIPSLIMTKMLREGPMTLALEDWFEANPQAQAKRHHAAIDAEALRQAWLITTGRTVHE